MKIYKAARWVLLLSSVIVLLLLFRTPQRLAAQQPAATAVAENAQSFQSKLGALEAAYQRGEAGAIVRLTADEVSEDVKVGNEQTPIEPTAALVSGPAADTPQPDDV